MKLHNRTTSQQAAEVKFVAFFAADGRNHADCSSLGVDHTDGSFVSDDCGNSFSRSFPRNNNHVKTNGTYSSHCFQLFDAQNAASCGSNHTRIFSHRNESSGKSADAGGGHYAAFLYSIVKHCKSRSGAVGTALLKADFL